MAEYTSVYRGNQIDAALGVIITSEVVASEVAYLHGAGYGSAVAGKAVVLNDDKDFLGIRNLGVVQLQAEGILLQDAGIPDAPDAGKKIFYSKAAGLFYKDENDNEYQLQVSTGSGTLVLTYDGNRVISNPVLENVNLGTNTINGFLDAYFFPEDNPGLQISSVNEYLMMGGSTSAHIAWSVTKKTLGINGISVYGVQITPNGNIDEDTDVYNNNQSETTLINVNQDTLTQVQLAARTTDNITHYLSMNIQWVYPTLIGFSDNSDLQGASAFTNLTKVNTPQESFSSPVNGSGYLYILIPDTYDSLEFIRSQKLFGLIDLFEEDVVSVSSFALNVDWTTNYKRYRTKRTIVINSIISAGWDAEESSLVQEMLLENVDHLPPSARAIQLDQEQRDIDKVTSGWVNDPLTNERRIILEWDDNTRAISLSLVDNSKPAYYYIRGKKYEITQATLPDPLVIANVDGEHLISINEEGQLIEFLEPLEEAAAITVLFNKCFTSYIYWSFQDQKALIASYETHTVAMSRETHLYLHATQNAQFVTGFQIANFNSGGNGDDPSHIMFDMGNGAIRDEDILHRTVHSATPSAQYEQLLEPVNLPVMYLEGPEGSGIWRHKPADQFPLIYPGDGVWTRTLCPSNYYNDTGVVVAGINPGEWGLLEVSDNDFFLLHVAATNDWRHPVIVILGQQEYSTALSAKDGAIVEVNRLFSRDLAFEEFVPLYSLIVQTSNGYDNPTKARFVAPDDEDYVDWRGRELTASAGVVENMHNEIPGRDVEGAHPANTISFTPENPANWEEQPTEVEKGLNLLAKRSTGGGSGIPEAPIDGNQYARKDAGWEKVIASGGSGTGVFEPVQDITELKALNTTDVAVWKDKWAILVEDEGQFYRLDRESAVSEALPQIVAPTTGVGRWIQDQKVQLDAKADKAVPTFSGNLAQLDSTGNLQDTGKQAEFIDIYNDVADATKTFLNNNENWLSGTTVLDQVTVEGKAGYRYKGTDFFFECINQDTWVRFPTDAQYFNPFDIPLTEKTKLENTGNWTAKVYTGTALVNCPIGSEHFDANYYFKFVDNNVAIRITRI